MSLVEILIRACWILAGIAADATRIDPDDVHSSPEKPRQEAWLEWSVIQARRLKRNEHGSFDI